ncbi:MAG: hypothetical protein ACM3JB_21115 [Acidobacteriaceae bacterium]
MGKKDKQGITQKHYVSLSEVSAALATLDVYGKIIQNTDVEPGPSGIFHPSGGSDNLSLATVVGYLDQGTCIRLQEPLVIAMPQPNGPADGCGWDPTEYVVWKNLPRNWTTLHLHVRTAGLHAALASGRRYLTFDQQLRADQIETILRDCIPLAGGSSADIDLSKTLQQYGFDKDGVVTLAGLIIGDKDHGVQRFDFQLAAGSLDSISVSSKLSELENLIQDKAVHK